VSSPLGAGKWGDLGAEGMVRGGVEGDVGAGALQLITTPRLSALFTPLHTTNS